MIRTFQLRTHKPKMLPSRKNGVDADGVLLPETVRARSVGHHLKKTMATWRKLCADLVDLDQVSEALDAHRSE
ncbi:hypothetical protein CIK64_07420 [Brevibacterium aurantiacum]|uniref:Uncharacterized protein n=2 Tax=Brevibacterium aurantiacum TaxID=273384 RepID=A0A2A3X8B6_BREAU|nr:hypothetical protein CIK79_17620 [Brevibacterium aurantiacum]PCC41338.1 hypothetical protein CIK65_18140 [Brevibacterium aurantiacum]PCC47316.1 hypothetical protein CIK64_07420 [Brevibacterium aurantiacum]RCS93806.1 hypothetical protein CIK60_18760 [Brevibacterium aurantiacum]